jgi:hypothetical protein
MALLDKHGYFKPKFDKQWTHRVLGIGGFLEDFLVAFIKNGGTLSEGVHVILGEVSRASQNAQITLLRKPDPPAKKYKEQPIRKPKPADRRYQAQLLKQKYWNKKWKIVRRERYGDALFLLCHDEDNKFYQADWAVFTFPWSTLQRSYVPSDKYAANATEAEQILKALMKDEDIYQKTRKQSDNSLEGRVV